MNDASRPQSAAVQTGDPATAVDEQRLWDRHMQMAEYGAIPNNGVNRQALSKEDIGARNLLISWAEARGYAIEVDGIGNLFIQRDGSDPQAEPVLTGSHMDSQPRGGRFDGIFGVLAGLEALEALDDAGLATRRPIEVVAWTNEEGSRFAPGAMGSVTFSGAREAAHFMDVTDTEGVYFGNALEEILAATPDLPRRPIGFPVACYVEAHIEQGPVLEQAETRVGVVTGIQGMRWFTVEVHGETAHAGTTPLAVRRDALQGAVSVINALNELTVDPEDRLRFTVGRLDVSPNSPNSVANHVQFSIDLRHSDLATLTRVTEAIPALCARAAGPCTTTVTETIRKDPTLFAPKIVDTIDNAAKRLAISSMRLPSGAFHDAGFVNDVCPSAMIFVPCRGGISHNEAEYSSPEQLADGTRVLAATLYELANAS